MSDEQDMRKMGGIYKLIPWTYALMWIGSLALAGIPIFAGYYSKDSILESAFAAHSGVGQYAFWLGIAGAVMTAFYSWRLLFMTFHGKPRADHHTMEHVHESPWVMLVPLIVLAAGAVLAGIIFAPYFVGEHMEEFWGSALFFAPDNHVPHEAHEVPTWVALLPLLMGIIGIGFAFIAYMKSKDLPAKISKAFGPIYTFVYRKWMFDELFDATLVRPAMRLGRIFWKGGDGAIIDGLGPDGISKLTVKLAGRASKLQSGYVYHYAFVMMVGVVALVTWYWYQFVFRG
jgi:NADH-quinone oxidoreductase subunit L